MVGRYATVLGGIAVATWLAIALGPTRAPAYVNFEAGPVRPLARTPDGKTLLALNTPDSRLEVLGIDGDQLTRIASIPVGLAPVAVAARTNSEIWVVNHLSDSVSIVDLAATPPRVVRTLQVGDEPRDVVFAGRTGDDGHFTRAFVTTARLGQNLPASVPLALTTPGTPRALVYVFDTADLGSNPDGTPETVIALFGDTPRALAASADGRNVYAAVFQSGNETTVVTEGAVCNGGANAPVCEGDGVAIPGGLDNGDMPGGLPAPNANLAGDPAPEVGLIVKRNRDSGVWEDELGRNWNNAVRFGLPDKDVFRIDALADPPREAAAFAHVGTVLFNMVVDPADGALYVSNTEARNEVRFEGPGTIATTVRGRLQESRITVIDGASVLPRHLNKHITALPQGYRTAPMPPAIKEASLATPMDMVVGSDGTLYVAAFGSSKVGVFSTSELKADSFVPDPSRQIEVSGGGPSGLALDEARHRLYVLTRFDNAVKVVDTASGDEIAQLPLFNPEPPVILAGRRFLYDARTTSSNGEASCASCHVFGEVDSLAWDLGNPDDVVKPNPNPLGPTGSHQPFHPLKGPMTTQTLQGLSKQGPMHWRGDRTGATEINDPRARDAKLAFEAFNVAFDSLLGRDEGPIADADMAAFADFALLIMPPPNPVRALDNSLTTAQANGRSIFVNRDAKTDKAEHCAGCHTLDQADGQFGTLGQTTFEEESQEFKVPQLKNMYRKVGMFGMPSTDFAHILPEDAQYQGDQIRGFGFMHDGSMATVFDFLRAEFFLLNDMQRAQLEEYVFAFETTFAPIVGQQLTFTSATAAAAAPRLALLLARASTALASDGQPDAMECELVVKAVVGGIPRGFLFDPSSGRFRSDRAAQPSLSPSELQLLATTGQAPVTYTCVPPGEGYRLGLDRDTDSVFDQDEIDNGTDPANPLDPFEQSPTPTTTRTATPFPTRTATPEGTATPTRRVAGTRTDTPTPTATATATVTATVPSIACAGDCNGDGFVRVNELITAVNIALEKATVDACHACDTNGDGHVAINELIAAVGKALRGC